MRPKTNRAPSGAHAASSREEGLARHLLRDVDAHVGEHGGGHVGDAARRAVELEGAVGRECRDERDGRGGVRGDGLAVGGEHGQV